MRDATSSGEVHAVVWINSVVFDLGAPAGATSHLEATGINDSGVVAGWYVTATGDTHGFVTADGSRSVQPPTVTCGAADGVWHSTDVSIACTASDAGSGLLYLADASVLVATPASPLVRRRPLRRRIRAVSATTPVTARLWGSIGGMPNRHGRRRRSPSAHRPVKATSWMENVPRGLWSAADAGSGVATCSGSAANSAPIDTSTARIAHLHCDGDG